MKFCYFIAQSHCISNNRIFNFQHYLIDRQMAALFFGLVLSHAVAIQGVIISLLKRTVMVLLNIATIASATIL